ncbi:MAG TPA: hypothetical protein PLY82_12385 [Methanosarcina thermophila]|nr:hypothetical protein [Methanosarcina thermophila]HPT81818.1 hypothetical protein [Methanosarcina thermophila]
MVKKCLINDALIQKCYDNLLLGMSQTACAKSIGVASSTWFNWQKLALEGKRPYADWWFQCQKAEAELQANCLKSVKLAMDHGDSKAAMFLLSTKFAGEGFGKQSQVNMNSQSVNMNYNTKRKEKADDEIRAEILAMLAPKNSQVPE